jgi:hypothetical protein
MMAKKIFTAFGRCQVNSVAEILCDYTEFSRQYEYRPLPQIHRMKPGDDVIVAETVSGCDLLLYQPIPNVSYTTVLTFQQVLGMLPERSRCFSFPAFKFEGYTPQLTIHQDIQSLFVNEHDVAIIHGLLSGLDPETVTVILSDLDFYEPEFSFTWIEAELTYAEKWEQLLENDFTIAAFLRSHWRDHRLFWSTFCPRRMVVEHITEQVLARLGIDATPRGPDSDKEIFRVVVPPIYPSTYHGLGLTFADDLDRCLTTQGVMPMLAVVRQFMSDYSSHDRAMLRMFTRQKPHVIERFEVIRALHQPIFLSTPVSKNRMDGVPEPAQPEKKQALPLTQVEADLLSAALSTDRESVFGAWQRWQKSVNLERIPGDQLLLLPRLYANLLRFGLSEEAGGRIMSAYQHAWYRNGEIRGTAAVILTAFDMAGLALLLIGASAAALDLYASLGERPVEQLDILIMPAFVAVATEVLQAAGWRPERPPALFTRGSYQYWVSQVSFRRFDQVPVVLHWRILAAARMTDFEGRLDKIVIDPTTTFPTRPYRETQLVLAGVKAAQGGRERLIALCDSGMALQAGTPLIGDRVLELACLLRVARPLAAALKTVSQLPGIAVDAAIMARLDELGTHELPYERLDHMGSSGVATLSSRLRFHVQRWRRIVEVNDAEPTTHSFLAYLQAVAGANRLRQLPLRLLQSAVRRPATEQHRLDRSGI